VIIHFWQTLTKFLFISNCVIKDVKDWTGVPNSKQLNVLHGYA
jgi:hypothetical protein